MSPTDKTGVPSVRRGRSPTVAFIRRRQIQTRTSVSTDAAWAVQRGEPDRRRGPGNVSDSTALHPCRHADNGRGRGLHTSGGDAPGAAFVAVDGNSSTRHALNEASASDPSATVAVMVDHKQAGLDGDESGADAPASGPDDHPGANGPLYVAAAAFMRAAQWVSLVEVCKRVAWKVFSVTTPDQKRRIANWTIDSFVIAKWILLLVAWRLSASNCLVVAAIVCLLIWNSITYFFYHLWIVEVPKERIASAHRERRRFISLVLAMAYSMTAYAYLYDVVVSAGFEWPPDVSRWIAAMTFSIGNALTSQAGGLRPLTGTAYLIGASQLVFTFGFVAMLLSSSLPRVRPS